MRLRTVFLLCFAVACLPALGWSAWIAITAQSEWANAASAVRRRRRWATRCSSSKPSRSSAVSCRNAPSRTDRSPPTRPDGGSERRPARSRAAQHAAGGVAGRRGDAIAGHTGKTASPGRCGRDSSGDRARPGPWRRRSWRSSTSASARSRAPWCGPSVRRRLLTPGSAPWSRSAVSRSRCAPRPAGAAPTCPVGLAAASSRRASSTRPCT